VIRTGLVNRLRLHIVPLLPGSGTAPFQGAGPELEHLDTVDTPEATHVAKRVRPSARDPDPYSLTPRSWSLVPAAVPGLAFPRST